MNQRRMDGYTHLLVQKYFLQIVSLLLLLLLLELLFISVYSVYIEGLFVRCCYSSIRLLLGAAA